MCKLSIVVPAYNEAANLPALYESLRKTLSALSTEWECIIVDDHSSDATFSVISALAIRDRRIRGIRQAAPIAARVDDIIGRHVAAGRCVALYHRDAADAGGK